MSHKFRKPMPISQARRDAARANGAKSHGPVTPEGKAKSALNAITHGLTASGLVMTTEAREKYDALLAAYRGEYNPQDPTENDLVEEIVAAKWQQRRIASTTTALLDVTMDRMEKEISEQFENIDNATRTALAFEKQVTESGTLALLNRYAARHARDYHRALNQLMQIQSKRRDQNNPPASPNEKLQNETAMTMLATPGNENGGYCGSPKHDLQRVFSEEPKPEVTPDRSTTSDAERPTSHEPLTTELATRHSPLETQTGHRPLVTDHCFLQNEPKPPETNNGSTSCERQQTEDNEQQSTLPNGIGSGDFSAPLRPIS